MHCQAAGSSIDARIRANVHVLNRPCRLLLECSFSVLLLVARRGLLRLKVSDAHRALQLVGGREGAHLPAQAAEASASMSKRALARAALARTLKLLRSGGASCACLAPNSAGCLKSRNT